MKSETVFNEVAKEFLSELPDEASAVCYNVTVKKNAYDEPFTADGGASFDCELRLQDCTRSIYLDFNLYSDDSPDAYRARVKKLGTLVRHLQDFRTHYIQAYEMYNKLKEDHTEANKAKETAEYVPHDGDVCDINYNEGDITHKGALIRHVELDDDGKPTWVVAVIGDRGDEPTNFNYDYWEFTKKS